MIIFYVCCYSIGNCIWQLKYATFTKAPNLQHDFETKKLFYLTFNYSFMYDYNTINESI